MKSNKKSQFLLILVIFIIILICYTSSLRKFSSINVNGESNEENNFNLKSSNQKVFSIIADPPDSENWTAKKNDAFPIFPDNFGIDSEGCYISHEWDESVNASRNTPSIHWERNVSIFEDMSYFKITSASVNAIVNATVHANNGINAGVDCPGDSVDQGFIFDYIRFYILISDLEKVQNYEIASFQTIDLGDDTAGTYDFLPDTFMNTASQEALEFYIGNVLETDHHNFTITLGMRIYCEDNYLLDDIDYWDNLRIKSFNLTFTYEKTALFIINTPESGQVFGEIAPEYNLYIIDGNLDTMWYTLNEGFTNITFTELTGTINQTEWNKVENGSVTIIFYANDTLGNLGFAEINIFKDVRKPLITINLPSQDQLYGEDAPQYNITIVEGNLDTMWYSLDEGITNITFAELTGTINQTEWNKVENGSVTIIFYANDTLGNLGFIKLHIYKDVRKPLIIINLPGQDLFYGENAPHYNITIVEGNLDTMWYSLDEGFTNITFTELTGIINQTAWDNKDDGPITIRFYANDTLGSLNYTDIIVYKDITTPISSIYYIPFGENNIVDKSTIFYLNATDDQGSGVSLIMYKINNSNWNIYTNYFNLSNYAYGYYNISYYAIDNAQNIEDVKTLLVLLKKPSDVNLIILGYDLIYLNSIIYIITIVLIVYYKKKK